MQNALLQAFHLSKPKKGATYIWADTGRQRYHDSFSSKHRYAGSDSGEDQEQSRRQIPARHNITGSDSLQQWLHSGKTPDDAKRRKEHGKHHLRFDLAGARKHLSDLGGDQNPVHLQLRVDGLTSESVSKMLAVHARTERRAQSLIDKVHALRRDCNTLLMTLPQHIKECASP